MKRHLMSLVIATSVFSGSANALGMECERVVCANQLALRELEMARLMLRMNFRDWKTATIKSIDDSISLFRAFELTDAYQTCARRGDRINCILLKDMLKTSVTSIFAAKGLFKPRSVFIERARQIEDNSPQGKPQPVDLELSQSESRREAAAASKLSRVSDLLGQDLLDQVVIMETFDAERFLNLITASIDHLIAGSSPAPNLQDTVIEAMKAYRGQVLILR